ncbi:MAG: cache domain-containing protein [Kiritimatiellia bacterium]
MNDNNAASSSERDPSRLMTAALAAIFAAGLFFSWWMIVRADRELRTELLQQTRLVARAVNLERVRALSGTEADLVSPDYRELKSRLIAVRSANPQCRFVYLLGRRPNGMAFFYVDSEPAGSKGYSPPGQDYAEAQEESRHGYDFRAETVLGPVADRWGVWVSGMVPLTGTRPDEWPVVLGLDVDARDWKFNVAAKAALPVGLMLVLLIVLAAVLVAARRVEGSSKPLLRRLLPSLALMVLLLMVGAGLLLYRQHRRQLAWETVADSTNVFGALRAAMEHQASGLKAAAQPIAVSGRLQKALREGDADRLLDDWKSVFETLRQESHISTLCFFDTNRVALMRVHMPDLRGDRVDRFTAREAERTGRTASGIELGPMGTFTLRVVQPVFEAGSRVGYVELGKEIDKLLQLLHLRSGNQLAVTIRKDRLDRAAWEAGRRRLGRKADWDLLAQRVVLYASQGSLPDAFAAWVDRAASGQAGSETDTEIASQGKTWRVAATPLPDASGNEVGELLVMRDISAEKAAFVRRLILYATAGTVLLALLMGFIYVLLNRADAALRAQQASLRESEEKHRTLFTEMMEGFALHEIICDEAGKPADYRFLAINPAFERMTGRKAGDLLGRTVLEVLPGTERHWIETYGKVALTGAPARFESFSAEMGKHFVVTAFRPAPNQFACVFSDITQHKRAETELQNMQKLQSVGTLAGGIAHDFNNILMGVFGNIALAKEDLPKDHPGYVSLEEAEKAMNRAVRLTKQLLTFAKGGEPVKENVSLGALVEEVARFDLSGSNVRLECRPAADLWLAEVDKGQIQQVISNLTINARQAMPEGGRLYIALENALVPEGAVAGLAPGKYVRVTLRDEGTGIEHKHLARIFDPYFTTKQSGNGLGLAIAYSVIQKHGGRIGVESELGKGTTFTLYLPASEAQPASQTESPDGKCTPLGRPARILVMDDEETVCALVSRMLARGGYSAATAPDGQQAVTLYKEAMAAGAPFDAVIMDLTIPGGIGGKEAIRLLLAVDPQARVIVSSGYAGDPVMANYADYGFKGIAAKPYTQSELRKVLGQVLG